MNEGTRLRPIEPRERIPELDILRGFALFGILCVNMAFFRSSPLVGLYPEKPPHGSVDRVVEFLVNAFANGKFNSMFSFLLGVGMTIQILRAAEKGAPFAGLYTRRLLALLAIGLIHAFGIWFGDVLIFYSVLGFGLLLLRRVPDRTLLAIAAFCMAIPIAVQLHGFFWPTPEEAPMAEIAAADLRAHTIGTYWDVFEVRLGLLIFFYTSPFGLAFASDLFVTLCLGLWAGRRHIFQNIPENLSLIRRVNRLCALIGIPSGCLYSALLMIHGDDFTKVDIYSVLYTVFYTLARPTMMLFYVSGILLLLQSDKRRGRLSQIGWIGRMPLTNYLFQSVVCTLLFYGYAGGLFNKVGYAVGLALTVFIWCAQIPLSYWWLTSFRFGPAEWLWRTITYATPQPMRLTSETSMRPVLE